EPEADRLFNEGKHLADGRVDDSLLRLRLRALFGDGNPILNCLANQLGKWFASHPTESGNGNLIDKAPGLFTLVAAEHHAAKMLIHTANDAVVDRVGVGRRVDGQQLLKLAFADQLLLSLQ